FKANTQEELDKIKSLEVEIMEKAINAYNTITVSPEFKELERLRSIARHNEASSLRNAKEEGKTEGKTEERVEIAKNALQMNLPIETIAKLTGLTSKEIKEL
ncbi:MAG: hypothetical protein FWC12_10740, partial [Treponema sp.]|nr:hypothetical protein [Treponema sp.]